jgi:arginyl-tRNA synthetase
MRKQCCASSGTRSRRLRVKLILAASISSQCYVQEPFIFGKNSRDAGEGEAPDEPWNSGHSNAFERKSGLVRSLALPTIWRRPPLNLNHHRGRWHSLFGCGSAALRPCPFISMVHLAIEEALREAVESVLGDVAPAEIAVRPCPDPKFGDYQTAGLMAIAKKLKLNPRQFALQVKEKLDATEWCEAVEIAGPGFLNFRLRLNSITEVLAGASRGEHLFITPSTAPKKIVLDYSSPNVAKPMHVGHIRSTILGNSLARALRALGHHVITDNHIGDWGTQFGKLLLGWKQKKSLASLNETPLMEMERLYKEVNTACEADPSVLEQARAELVKLQSGDEENLKLWREMIEISLREFEKIYKRLGVEFDQTLGESFYNPRLAEVVDDLIEKGLSRESEGAIVFFFDDDPELKNTPAVIRKSDGAANYTTTDLATLLHRLETWQPDEIIYVTDARQQLHFKQLFKIFRGWKPAANVSLKHVWFGMILGEDGRPFRTRTGETVKLEDLLDEAEERAHVLVSDKSPEIPEAERREIARVVGLGAIKYADLLPNRQSDYVFSWDKMLALNGNTAPYLQYASTRIDSIFRRAGLGEETRNHGAIALSAPEERALGLHLLNFGLALEAVIQDSRPNLLCNYLFELAGFFAAFYENCPVLKSEGAEKASRLELCRLTGKVLTQGLDILGIETPGRM